jgi:glycosyltransferase involved in cell wall biosynthesis
MLSLLIPLYNYNVVPLVLELQNQCKSNRIAFEIIVLDDASNLYVPENYQINALENCQFLANTTNLGRASTLNKLVALAKFEYVLILEADAFPTHKNYIQLYVAALNPTTQAVFGGVLYSDKKPPQDALLRWIYGNARESKSLAYRLEHPFDIVFSWNLLLKKSLFLRHPFDASIKTYGFEDLVFLKILKKNNIPIQQIENTLVHQNEELSTIFIEKSKKATLNLIALYQKNVLTPADSRLLNAFEILKKWHLTTTVAGLFTFFESIILENLGAKKPDLRLFDLYRLGYFCKNIQLKNTVK